MEYNKIRKKASQLDPMFPSPDVTIKLDHVLWRFAQFYRDKLLAKGLPRGASEEVVAIGAVLAFEKSGDAIRFEDPDGSITWKATPKFLKSTGLEAGSLVIIQPGGKPLITT
jgi:hypothetical protein